MYSRIYTQFHLRAKSVGVTRRRLCVAKTSYCTNMSTNMSINMKKQALYLLHEIKDKQLDDVMVTSL